SIAAGGLCAADRARRVRTGWYDMHRGRRGGAPRSWPRPGSREAVLACDPGTCGLPSLGVMRRGADERPRSLCSLDSSTRYLYIKREPALLATPQERSIGPEDACGTESEASMSAVSASKAWKILIALVACLMAVATTVCLVHTDGIGEAPIAHQGHRHTSSSPSAHITLDLHCLLAILPTVVVLVWLCLGAFSLAV